MKRASSSSSSSCEKLGRFSLGSVRFFAVAFALSFSLFLSLLSRRARGTISLTSSFLSPTSPLLNENHEKQSFKLHIGGEITLPTRFHAPLPQPPSTSAAAAAPLSANEVAAAAAAESPRLHDPFEGVPLRAWAEKLGERVMPAYEAVKAEEARRKAELLASGGPSSAALLASAAAPALSVPSVFPLTRWAASSPAVRSTLVAPEDPKERPKARLSWYHPDDTMVPRDWFRGGLLKDFEYYRPFRSPVAGASSPEPALA